MKSYLHRPIQTLHLLTTGRIQKCLTNLKYLASLTICHVQAEMRIFTFIFTTFFSFYLIGNFVDKKSRKFKQVTKSFTGKIFSRQIPITEEHFLPTNIFYRLNYLVSNY